MGHGHEGSSQNTLTQAAAQRPSRLPLAALFAAAGFATGIAACSSSTSPSSITNGAISTDLAGSAAGAAGQTVLGFAGEDSGSGASGSVILPHGYRAALARTATVCANPHFMVSATFPGATNLDTISASVWWSFWTAGQCQGAFDANSTDSIVFVDTAALALNGPRGEFHGHLDVTRRHWVTGHPTLHGDTVHTWSGSAAGADTSVFTHDRSQWNYTAAAADTVSRVVFAHPRNGDNYPHRGTFSRWVSGNVVATGATTGTASFTRHILVTFSGGPIAQMQVLDTGTGAVVLTCSLDLANDKIVANSCH